MYENIKTLKHGNIQIYMKKNTNMKNVEEYIKIFKITNWNYGRVYEKQKVWKYIQCVKKGI